MIESVYQAKVGSLMNQIRAYQDRAEMINSDVGTQQVDQTEKSGFGEYMKTEEAEIISNLKPLKTSKFQDFLLKTIILECG